MPRSSNGSVDHLAPSRVIIDAKRLFLLAIIALGAIILWRTDLGFWAVAGALAFAYVFLRIGFAILAALGTPIPEPPPAGELRKVKIMFRCSICGTEVRMTTANDEMPEPPRHCLEDMDLVAPIE